MTHTSSPNDHAALARAAFVWGLPLVLMGRYLDAAEEADVPFNRFFMNSEVATPRSHAIGPNIDTLNGRAWLDLATGPQVIAVPDTSDRYYSIQLQDMYMNSFAYIGRRTTGTKAGVFAIVPPGFDGELPAGVSEVRATTGKVLAFVRTLVRGPEDLAAAQAINASITLGALSDFPQGHNAALLGDGATDAFQPDSRRSGGALPHQDIAAAGVGYFEELDRLVRAYPPLPEDAPNLSRFAPLGVGAGGQGARDPALAADLAAAVPGGLAAVMQSLKAASGGGWLRRPNVAPITADPLQRAANNIYGPGTQIAEESVFFNRRQGPGGEPLTGANRYRLRFAAGETPPVDAFWSLTLYNEKYVLFDNPIDRYGVTDRTDGLRYGPGGSLDIQLQSEPPAEGRTNWLPTPHGEFQLVLRTYQPREPLLSGRYRLPPLENIGSA